MSSSVSRVERAAAGLGLPIAVRRMTGSTRTAEEAAAQCGTAVGQIVKSLIFLGETSKSLYLFLVAGNNRLDPGKAAALAGEHLVRADPRDIRERTGFAIGGVSPIGHKTPLTAFADETLLTYSVVWAAAGAPDAVFSAEPAALLRAANATAVDIRA